MGKNVFIANEQTLYAALRMVKLTWQQIQQAENQQRVFELANEMLARVGQFVKQMGVIGDSLDKAQKAYDAGMKKFSEKGQSLEVERETAQEGGEGLQNGNSTLS